jgi:AmmeMemoRadiSam system protein B
MSSVPPARQADARRPAVAGAFYPADPTALNGEIDACYHHPRGPGRPPDPIAPTPLAVVAPHAGIRFSGPFAAHAYAVIGRPAVVVLLGPNHDGIGASLALSAAASWRTPLGDLALDNEVAAQLRDDCPALVVDERAHRDEHSLELQAIFLQHALGAEVRIVPIALATRNLDAIGSLATALARAAARPSTVLVASTDLSHFLPDRETRDRDRSTLAAIESLDVDGLIGRLSRGEAAACGAAGVIAVMLAARQLGAGSARLLAYGTSGDTGGPRDSVVGYAALQIARPLAS